MLRVAILSALKTGKKVQEFNCFAHENPERRRNQTSLLKGQTSAMTAGLSFFTKVQ